MYSSQSDGRRRSRPVHLVPESIAKGMRLGAPGDGLNNSLLSNPDYPQQGPSDPETIDETPSNTVGSYDSNGSTWTRPLSYPQKFEQAKTWINLTNSRIKFLNRIAIGIHFVMAIVAIIGRYSIGSPTMYMLKYDRIHLNQKLKENTTLPMFQNSSMLLNPKPLLQLASPFTGTVGANYSAPNGVTIGETCKLALPTELDFAGSQNLTMQMWSYPRQFAVQADIGWCVAAFFLLSFLFQLMLEVLGSQWGFNITALSYDIMFDERSFSDATDDLVLNNAMTEPYPDDVKNELLRRLHFNWLRFIEYFASGSLVLLTVALLAGIVDVELLVCMFFLAATCMGLGLVAEFALRAKFALDQIVKYAGSRGFDVKNYFSEMTDVLQDISDKMYMCFWISHFLGWVCIAIPWAIIIMHYVAWWNRCDADSLMPPPWLWANSTTADADGEALRRNQPPDAVLGAIILEVVLYFSFGMVQLVQGFSPGYGNRTVEVAYILLSLIAKFALGALLFSTTIFV